MHRWFRAVYWSVPCAGCLQTVSALFGGELWRLPAARLVWTNEVGIEAIYGQPSGGGRSLSRGDGGGTPGPARRRVSGLSRGCRGADPRVADWPGDVRLPAGVGLEEDRPGTEQVLQRSGGRGQLLLVLHHRSPRQTPGPRLPGHGLLRPRRQAGVGRRSKRRWESRWARRPPTGCSRWTSAAASAPAAWPR